MSHDELRLELRSLLGATRALLDHHRVSGASGLPRSAAEAAPWPPRVDDLLARQGVQMFPTAHLEVPYAPAPPLSPPPLSGSVESEGPAAAPAPAAAAAATAAAPAAPAVAAASAPAAVAADGPVAAVAAAVAPVAAPAAVAPVAAAAPETVASVVATAGSEPVDPTVAFAAALMASLSATPARGAPAAPAPVAPAAPPAPAAAAPVVPAAPTPAIAPAPTAAPAAAAPTAAPSASSPLPAASPLLAASPLPVSPELPGGEGAEPPFGITALPPLTEPVAVVTEVPPVVTEAPAAVELTTPPGEMLPAALGALLPAVAEAAGVAVAAAPRVDPGEPSLFEGEPTQGALPGLTGLVDERRPRPMRGLRADLPAPRTPEAHRHLEVLAERVSQCTSCALHQGRTRTVFARGNPDAEVCFVGEAPGPSEDASGQPFVGPAGQLLDRMISAMGLSQDEVYITTLCRCRPPGDRVPTADEMAACIPFLHEQLAVTHPRVIVALGATATKGLLPTALGIKALRGTWKLYRTTPLMPTYHPAYLLRETEAGRLDAKREVWKDLQAVLERLGRSLPPRGKP